MPSPAPLSIGGYVLAGGRSSRMGEDKALLELAGRPLVEHAVLKLRRVCQQVNILSANSALARFAPTVTDLHPGSGPLGGIEAALARSTYEWNLIVPVDVPFPPAAFLYWWAQSISSRRGVRLSFFRIHDVPQPALLMIHRDMAPYLTVALAQGQYKLGQVLQSAAEDFAVRHGESLGTILKSLPIDEHFQFGGMPDFQLSEAQQRNRVHWFANLNTPEDFADASLHLNALDQI